jgi:hypothetical protein
MRIAIISDTHDNLPNIDKMLGLVKALGIENIIHCGDVCAPMVMRYIAENFPGQVHLVFGNVDGDHDMMNQLAKEKLKNVIIYGEIGKVTLGGKKIAFTHKPDGAKQLAASGKFDLVFYGHTHKPWEETINSTKMINPGTLAGLFAKATFAVYDTATGKLELKILELL